VEEDEFTTREDGQTREADEESDEGKAGQAQRDQGVAPQRRSIS
jgi:hypothetical protein